jgi:ADP-ribose pyrophosphatase YjhB (NUDIX family)
MVRKNGGYWPDQDTVELAHGCMPIFATELIILRKAQGGEHEILLEVYHHTRGYPQFEGRWHAPGGYARTPDPDLEAVSNRVARRELGIGVRLVRMLGAEWWGIGEHPYGRPLSLLMLCEPLGLIPESEERGFFPVTELPQPMIEVHERFIKKFVPVR